jgi:hypothetical protein
VRNSKAKLSVEQVLEVYRRVHAGESQVVLAKEFGIRPSAVSRINLGKSWAHVTGHKTGAEKESRSSGTKASAKTHRGRHSG